jgi:acyl phosphate:glycerol-3-phosphate acyltransferase
MSICILILVTHQKNIERLLKGKESKVVLFKKKTV